MSAPAALRRVNFSSRLERALILGLSLAISLGALFWWDFPPKQYALQIGEVSRVRINAPRQIIFDSASRTREAQDRAAASIADAYDPPDPQIGRRQLMRAQSVLNFLDSVRHDPYPDFSQKLALVSQLPELNMTASTLSETLGIEDARWAVLARESLAALEQVMRTEIRPEHTADARSALQRFVSRELNTEETLLAGELVKGFVAANSLPNPQRTALLKEEARRTVAPARVTIRQDETILREGEVITPAALEALEALGLLQTQRDLGELSGQWLIGALLSALIAFYFGAQPPQLWAQGRRISLILGLTCLTVLATKLMTPTNVLQIYLLPVPAVGMMLALIFGAPSAVMIAACLSIIAGQMAGDNRELEAVVYTFAGSAMGAISVNRIERINSFARAGLIIALVNIGVILSFMLLAPSAFEPFEAVVRIGAGLLNAIFSVSLALAGYSLAGHYLGVTTPLQLMELARPTHPLLRDLLLKAPGTYHHTLLISNMAERAAELTGGDPLLARVAAYYHDIGKTVQPYFFIENQIERENPHDELNNPYESARIVIQHVPDGLELARKHRLPKPIADVIAQHHGTMLTAYFYHRAKAQAPNGEVDETLFRYPGPRPQSREAAIIMLADGAEATVRATRPNTVEELDEVLKKIFRDRLSGGELDDSSLHLRDLANIRRAFVEILQGQFHPRINYPSDTRDATPEPQRGIWLENPSIPAKEK